MSIVWKVYELLSMWFDYWKSFGPQAVFYFAPYSAGPKVKHELQDVGEFTLVQGDGFPMAVQPYEWPYSYSYDGWAEWRPAPFVLQPSKDTVVRGWVIYDQAGGRVLLGDNLNDPALTVAAGQVYSMPIVVNLSDHGPPCPE